MEYVEVLIERKCCSINWICNMQETLSILVFPCQYQAVHMNWLNKQVFYFRYSFFSFFGSFGPIRDNHQERWPTTRWACILMHTSIETPTHGHFSYVLPIRIIHIIKDCGNRKKRTQQHFWCVADPWKQNKNHFKISICEHNSCILHIRYRK